MNGVRGEAFIGSSVVRALVQRGVRPRVFTRGSCASARRDDLLVNVVDSRRALDMSGRTRAVDVDGGLYRTWRCEQFR
jgi:uncharacterized protein YbjT (DUF2867 family)